MLLRIDEQPVSLIGKQEWEDVGLAVIPPIVVLDELAQGLLVEALRLPGISEAFLAVTRERRFLNRLLTELLALPAKG